MDSTPEQLRFASIPGCTIRADFAGGGLSSDLGPLLLKGVDRQIGLTERVCAAIDDSRHPGYITHSLHDILKQRIYQIASGYEDGNDCNSLRHDPVFRLGVGTKPFDTDEAEGTDGALASGSTISRFEHAVTRRAYVLKLVADVVVSAELERRIIELENQQPRPGSGRRARQAQHTVFV